MKDIKLMERYTPGRMIGSARVVSRKGTQGWYAQSITRNSPGQQEVAGLPYYVADEAQADAQADVLVARLVAAGYVQVSA